MLPARLFDIAGERPGSPPLLAELKRCGRGAMAVQREDRAVAP